MKTRFYKGQRSDEQIVLCTGWGMDPTPFEAMLGAVDTLVAWDYSTLEPLTLEEKPTTLIAWSMGVWAAERVVPQGHLKAAIAVNGTPWPIDETKGIAPAVFDGTLSTFSDAGLTRFRRRMCGGMEGLKGFLAHVPQRTTEDLRGELAALGQAIREQPVATFPWTQAIVCAGDHIFPKEAQVTAWQTVGIPITEREGAHWDPTCFAELLQGNRA